MPFTPLHMGPGLVVKACMQGAFSLMVFGWTQIVIDIQPLIVMMSGKGELHGFSHTYIGATIIAIVAALTGKHLAEVGLGIFRMQEYNPISWRVAIISAFIGGYSHVFIDSIMHSDVMPFSPFSEKSIFYRVVNIDTLHSLCIVSAVVGGVGFYLIERIRKNT